MTVHRKVRRLPHHNYLGRQTYFVTICCNQRFKYLREQVTAQRVLSSLLKCAADLSFRQLDHIHHVVQHAQFQVIFSHFENALVTKLGLTRQEWLDRRSDTGLRLEGRELLKKIKPDFSCLIAGV